MYKWCAYAPSSQDHLQICLLFSFDTPNNIIYVSNCIAIVKRGFVECFQNGHPRKNRVFEDNFKIATIVDPNVIAYIFLILFLYHVYNDPVILWFDKCNENKILTFEIAQSSKNPRWPPKFTFLSMSRKRLNRLT